MNFKLFTSPRYWQILLMLTLLAFSLRIARNVIINRISKDGVLYVRMAEHVQSGEQSTAFIENRRMPPLYILMIASAGRLGIPLESAAVLISIIAGSLLVMPIFLVVRLFFGTKIATFSGLLIAVHPSLVDISANVMRDSLFLGLFVFAFSSLVFAIDKNRLLFWGIAGCFTAWATATRAEGFELIIAVLLWMFVDIIMQKREDGTLKPALVWSRTLAGPLIFLLLFFIASLPIINAVKGTASEWSVVDKRMVGYVKGLLHNSSEEVLKTEDTL